jgi:hypothetical protein
VAVSADDYTESWDRLRGVGDHDSVVVEITPRRIYAWGFD